MPVFKSSYAKPILVAVIAIIAAISLWKKINQTGNYQPDMFALKNPEQIDAFRFVPNDPKNAPLYFKKKNNQWYVCNQIDTFPADSQNVQMLLNWAMRKLKVQRPVTGESVKNLSRKMALSAVKASFSINGKEVHSIYVGGSTQDNMATYMYKADYDNPCIVEIPGFQGYLTPYFNNDIHIWRTLKLVQLNPNDIQSLKVTWPQHPEKSFEILQENNQIQIKDSKNSIRKANRSLLAGYLILCSEFSREAGTVAGINKDKQLKDSISSLPPIISFQYTTTQNQVTTLNVFAHQGFEDIIMDARPDATETVQTALYWVKSSQDPHLWLSQDIVLQNRMKSLSDFLNP